MPSSVNRNVNNESDVKRITDLVSVFKHLVEGLLARLDVEDAEPVGVRVPGGHLVVLGNEAAPLTADDGLEALHVQRGHDLPARELVLIGVPVTILKDSKDISCKRRWAFGVCGSAG